MTNATCFRGHPYVWVGSVRVCECGVEPGKEHLKGIQEEVKRLVTKAGGLDQIRREAAYAKEQKGRHYGE